MGRLGRPTDLSVALSVAEKVVPYVESLDGIEQVIIAGSVRRQRPIVNDLDLVIVSMPWARDLTYLRHGEDKAYHWTPKGGVASVDDVRVEMFLAPTDCAGATLQWVTGPGSLNVWLRFVAKRQGLKLSQYGLIDAEKQRLDSHTGDPYTDEASIFDALSVPFMLAEQRDDWRELK
jgi:DNA polymerase (family 10)